MNGKKLLIISSYIDDKPLGGVTMHVHRLIKTVIEPHVSSYILCDYKNEGIITWIRKIKEANVMHIHASSPYLKLFLVISARVFGTVSLLTIHGRYGSFNKWRNFFNKLALIICNVPILINKESYEAVSSFKKTAVYLPAFLPPIKEEEKLSNDIESLITNIKSNGNPLFVTNASSMAFTDDGLEIYGIRFLIDYFSKKKEFNLLILDPQGQYYSSYKNCLPHNITIVTGNHSFCGVMERADVVIRNTPIDGDSFSVKEALYYRIKILATDAVSRPRGVILYHYNDDISFEKAVTSALKSQEDIDYVEENSIQMYMDLYTNLGVSVR